MGRPSLVAVSTTVLPPAPRSSSTAAALTAVPTRCPRASGSTATLPSHPVAPNAMENATPLRRLGHVDDIASAILYLVSPAGAYVTGKIIEVDGGLQSPNLEFPLPDL